MDADVALKIRTRWSAEGSLRADDYGTMSFLGAALDDANEEVAVAAAEVLARLAKSVHPELPQALNDASEFAREYRHSSDAPALPDSISVLFEALGAPEGYVCHCVVWALAGIGSRVVPDLLATLVHAEDGARASAAWALGKIGDPIAIPALATLLQHRKRFVRDCAVHALVRFGSPAVPNVVEALRDERSRPAAVEALGWIGDASAAPALLQAMLAPERGGSWDFRMAFKRIGPAARPCMLNALQDPNESIRANAVTALSAIPEDDDVFLLLDALRDPGRFGLVRREAVYALGHRREGTAIPGLLEALHDRHEAVRAGAVASLGTYREMALVPALIQALGDSSFAVRTKALDALTEWNNASMLALEHALLDPNEAIRVGAATALRRIQEDSELPRRILLLPGVAPAVRVNALEALEKAHYAMPRPAVLCRSQTADPDSATRRAAEDVLRILEPPAAPASPQRGLRIFGWKLT